jgi:protein tyrosine/serine phosphatase
MKKLAILGAGVVLVGGLGLGTAYMNGSFKDRPTGPKAGAPAWAKERSDVAGCINVGEVSQGKLYRGAQPDDPAGYDSLKKLGVKTIINLRDWTDESKEVKKEGLEGVRIPLQADIRGAKPPTPEEIAKFLSIVTDPSKQPVYFHCAHGKDRTGTMAAVYRMEVDGWTNEQAWDEMQHFGFNYVWINFEEFVKNYKPTGKWRATVASADTAPQASK